MLKLNPMQENKYAVLNVKYTDYTPELAYQIEILSTDGNLHDLYQSVINPGEPIFDYGMPAEFGIKAEDIDSAPKFPEIFEKIIALLSDKIVFYHMSGNMLALQANVEKYKLSMPEATYINTEKIVRRVWTERSKNGYGLRSMRQMLDIPDTQTAVEATWTIVERAAEKAKMDIKGLVELASKRYYRVNKKDARLQCAEGNPNGPLAGETIVFTGSLDRPRTELRDMVVELGCNFADSLNRDTTILVVGTYNNPSVLTTGKSGKLAKAEKYNKESKANIEILSSDSFYRIISEFTHPEE